MSDFPFGNLPDPLVLNDGTPVADAETWRTRRRPELLEFFQREMYGVMPGRPERMTWEITEDATPTLNGRGLRKQITLFFDSGADGPRMDVLLYVPAAAAAPVPCFACLSFRANHFVHADPGIALPENARSGESRDQAEAERGKSAWPIETILARGYALAVYNYQDIAPDSPEAYTSKLLSLYPELGRDRRGDDFSAIGAWAWGLSRMLDYLETDPAIDVRRVAAFGHSRLGKTSLWAAASDERFALAISNESGAGGAKLFRRNIGENIRRLNTVFPQWFCANFEAYNDRDAALPFDQHEMIALIAPRPVYVASAEADRNADPEGEFWSAKCAEPVYHLLGTDGLPADAWPPLNESVQGRIGYHVRTGGHDVTQYDWEQYLDFADKYLQTSVLI